MHIKNTTALLCFSFFKSNFKSAAPPSARRPPGGRQEGRQGVEAVQKRDADGQHRIPVDRRPRHCRQGAQFTNRIFRPENFSDNI
jgi:hypothetical protein